MFLIGSCITEINSYNFSQAPYYLVTAGINRSDNHFCLAGDMKSGFYIAQPRNPPGLQAFDWLERVWFRQQACWCQVENVTASICCLINDRIQ